MLVGPLKKLRAELKEDLDKHQTRPKNSENQTGGD
jgi:hypothetical protein